MNRLVISDSVRQILENNPNSSNRYIKKSLLKDGIKVSGFMLNELKNSNNFDRELLEIEILKRSLNINYYLCR